MSTKFASKTGRVAAGGSLLVGGVAGALVLAPRAGAAMTFHVTTTSDSGAGSLRQAIFDAESNPGADFIVFDASSAGTITLTSGQIAIHTDVTITGLGAADSIISGNNSSRIFYLYNGASALTVSISGLTLTDGSAANAGGAIKSKGNDLILSGVTVTGNSATAGGGGVYSGDYGGRFAPLTIIDSEISNNTVLGGGGGGLSLYKLGDVTITNTVVSGNTGSTNGGGVDFDDVGNVAIANSSFSANSTEYRGGGARFYQAGNISIVNSSFVDNEVRHGGGGGAYIRYAADISIDSSTFDQNLASSNDGGGLYASYSDSFTMTSSTVSGNEAFNGAGVVLRANGNVLFANTTIANNVGDLLYGAGGAVWMRGSTGSTHIMFSTISGNVTRYDTVRLVSNSPNTVEITGTIISDNTTQSGSGTQAIDVNLIGSASATLTNSLIMGSTYGGSFTDGGGNVHGVSAHLSALADNGGPTFTMQPAAGSPVIDAGPLTWMPFNRDAFDQRATPYVRVYDGQSDMGAIEVQPGPTPPSTTTTAPDTTTTTPVSSTTTSAFDPVAPAFTG